MSATESPTYTRRRFVSLSLTALATGCFYLPCAGRAQNAGRKWALLIGIDEYQDTNHFNPLSAAARDARALKDTLIKAAGFPDDNIRLLVSDGQEENKPTRANILGALADLSDKVKEGDTVFVLYSGHGVEIGNKAYLLPWDTRGGSETVMQRTAIDEATFRDDLMKLRVETLVMAWDMCRTVPFKDNNRAASTPNPLTPGLRGAATSEAGVESKPRARVVVTLFACTEGQSSYEWIEKKRGYFSYFLEKGLLGEAADETGAISVGRLFDYVSVQVGAQKGDKQTPYPRFEGPNADKHILARVAIAPAPVTPIPAVAANPVASTPTKPSLGRIAASLNAAKPLVPGLLQEAKQMANAISDASKKSSALVSIAGAQAISRDAKGSVDTLKQAKLAANAISDASKKSSALASIAGAQAEAGDVNGAKQTANAISDASDKSSALVSIAGAQAKSRDAKGSVDTLKQAKLAANAISDASKKSSALASIAGAQAEAGDANGAKQTANAISDASDKSSALVSIAGAQAKSRDAKGSVDTLEQAKLAANAISDASDKSSALVSIAGAQAEAGDAKGSVDTLEQAKLAANAISDASKKSSALASIAGAQAKSRDAKGSVDTLKQAKLAANAISDAYVKSLALTSIAEAQVESGDMKGASETFTQAVQMVTTESDDFLRSSELWDIVVKQAAFGDVNGAKQAVNAITKARYKAWTLVSIAEAQASFGDVKGSVDTLKQAKLVANAISDASDKSSALSSIAVAQARSGDVNGARQTVQEIIGVEERIEALWAIVLVIYSDTE